MADTLLQICQDIADETGVQSPIAVMSSNVENARRMRGHALRAARYVARSHDWQALESVATITTVATQQAYARPADFKSWLPNTHWDNTNYQPMEGPVSGPRFEALNRSQLASAGVFTRFFRLRGNQVLIYPVPSTSGETLTYLYRSNAPVLDTDGTTAKTRFTADTDTVRIPEEPFKLFLQSYFLEAMGEDYAGMLLEAEVALDLAKAEDQNPKPHKVGEYNGAGLLGRANFPNSGYGGI